MNIKEYFKYKKAQKDILYFCKIRNFKVSGELEKKLVKFQKDCTIMLTYPRDNEYMKIIRHWMEIKGMI